MIIGLGPLISQIALWDPVKKRKIAHFLPQSPFVVEFGLAVVIANVVSFMAFGKKGLLACWDPLQLFQMSPISIFHGLSEVSYLITFCEFFVLPDSGINLFQV